MTEENQGEAVAAEVPRRNWVVFARRPVQWTETYAIDGDPRRGVMLTALYTASRLAADAEVSLEATLIVQGEARATVVVAVTGLPDWRWNRLFTWADQSLMGIEAEARAQAVAIAAKPARKRVVKPAVKPAVKSAVKPAVKLAVKRGRKIPKE
jgi:hypothetical protein